MKTCAVLLLVALLAGAVHWALEIRPDWWDWDAYHYWRAAERVAHGAPVYVPLAGHECCAQDYVYPPFWAVVWAPIAGQPWVPAAWSALNLALANVFMLLPPVYESVGLGQVNMLVLALLLAAVWLMQRHSYEAEALCTRALLRAMHRRAVVRNEWTAGALLGLAAGIKLWPLAFVPALLLCRRDRAAWGLLAGFVATLAIGCLAGPGQTVWFLTHLREIMPHGAAGNMSLWALLGVVR